MKKKLFYLILILISPLFYINLFGQTSRFQSIFIGPTEVGYIYPTANTINLGIQARNGRGISFRLLNTSNQDLEALLLKRGRNDDVTLLFPTGNKWNRFTTAEKGIFAFSTGGRGNTDDLADFLIDAAGNIGIGIKEPIDKLTMADGNFRMENKFVGNNPNGIFQIRTGYINNRYWLGTTSEHILTIGAHGKGMVNFFPEKYTVFYKSTSDADLLNISTSNINKYALFVEGGILSENYGLAPVSSWADYVFEKDYKLRDIKEVEEFINTNGHLPDIPSAEKIANEGYSLHDMNVKLLQKIEELTLYVIDQDKRMRTWEEENEQLKSMLEDYGIKDRK